MANRCGDRFQLALFPASIEDYVTPNDPVRAYEVPSQWQALHEEEGPSSNSHFLYDKEQDCYWCPQGHRLSYAGTDKGSGKRHYQITHREICRGCVHYGQCTEAMKGRKIIRLALEEVREMLGAQYEESSSSSGRGFG